jgi:hypothetical protein
MPTHSFQQGSGFKVTGGTGGISAGNSIAGTVVTEEIRSIDDAGSNDLGVRWLQIGFANAPGNCAATADGSIKWFRSGTNGLRITVTDDSSATGETGTSDSTYSNRPAASGSPATNSFEGATGEDDGSQYNRSLGTYSYGVREQQVVDGEGYNDTVRDDIYYNSVKVYDAGYVLSSTWSPGDSVSGDSDNYTYTVGAYQEVYNDDTYYAVVRSVPSETHYSFNATAAITGIRAVFTPTTSSSSGTGGGGALQPVKTFDGTAVPNNTTLSAMDSGWKTTANDMSTGVTLAFIQTTGTMSDSSAIYTLDGRLDFYARTATSGDTLVKSIRMRAQTTADSVY